MERIERGMLAWSRAGHDTDTLYLVCGVEGDFVYLCDGRIRGFQNPKKKNRKHIQVIRSIPEDLADWDGKALKNEEIRAILKKYKAKEVPNV
ncbi:MAG: hypothetical protein ACI4CZ_07255 [Hominisplanchenecus sp.]